jgi:hypothetical protein
MLDQLAYGLTAAAGYLGYGQAAEFGHRQQDKQYAGNELGYLSLQTRRGEPTCFHR